MLTKKELGHAIRTAIDLKLAAHPGLLKQDIAKHFGVKPPSVQDWMKKGSIDKGRLNEIYRFFADVVGYDHWGLTRDEWPAGLLPLENSAGGPNAAYSVHRAEEPKVQFNVVPIGTRHAVHPAEYIRLEIYDIRVAAGPGAAEVDHPDVVSHLPVLREWALDNLGSADPKVIKLVTAAGDSMHPTIEDGALLFVDVRVRGFQGDGIYCLAWNGGMLVKRLVALRDGSLQIVSDNPSGPSPEIVKGPDLDRIAICGRVKRWWSLRKA